ncbi:hypothetical protein H2203_002508 [Taxawa tesnikishii (nom. ined.)]|nr:hypothetical protein H2203_002508 [Dothideales sp. JES 119]
MDGGDDNNTNRPALKPGARIKKTVSFRRQSGASSQAKSLDVFRANKSLDGKGAEEQDEYSPLIGNGNRRSPDIPKLSNLSTATPDEEEWDDDQDETRSSWYLLLLTLGIGGLQIAWSVELSNGSPYLLGLGISKSLLAFVWIAGPLSGTLVQPYVGIKSDNSRSKWGKRRPFVVGGAIATIISLVALAWTREIISNVLHVFGVDREAPAVYTVAIVFAVLMIYVLDFSINVIQAAIRAFIVDNAPAHQQNEANAWASRMSGVGNIIGYLSGYVDLPKIMPFFGDTQFKVLCVIACLALAITVGISCFFITERDPRLEGEPTYQEEGVLAFFKNLFRSMKRLPPQISKVCMVQFFAWIGWFPFLFYITTYIGEIYVEPFFEKNPHMTPQEIDETWERATRIGTFALLVFAITTFASSVVLPLFVQPMFKAPAQDPDWVPTPGTRTPRTPGQDMSNSGSYSHPGYFSYHPVESSTKDYQEKGTGVISRIGQKIPSPRIPGFTLRRAWLLSHLLFAIATWCTFFIDDTKTATVLVAFIGIPWAMTNWAPFAIISAEISKRDAIRRGQMRAPPTRDGELLANGEDEAADQAGVVLGIHNVAIAAPQVIATLVSSVIFRFLQKPRGSVGDNSVAWVLRFGGCAAVIAAVLTARLEDQPEEADEED